MKNNSTPNDIPSTIISPSIVTVTVTALNDNKQFNRRLFNGSIVRLSKFPFTIKVPSLYITPCAFYAPFHMKLKNKKIKNS